MFRFGTQAMTQTVRCHRHGASGSAERAPVGRINNDFTYFRIVVSGA
jgi:hypothetical protein